MDEPREETFRGRCTAEQKQRWEKASRLSKRTLSDWMRIVLDEEAERVIARAEAEQTRSKGRGRD